MEKRTVRIYKAPDGKGRYINKTSQFLHKAQEGAQVDDSMDQYVQYIQSELQNQTDPQEIYQNLVEAGLPEENAQSLIQQIMQGMPQSQEAEPAQEVEAAQYRDGGEQEVLDQYAALTDQGQEDPESYSLDAMIENTPGTQTFKFPGLDQYIPSYNPIGWDQTNVDAEGNATFERGGTKKSFAKNVLAYLKKQEEGGEGDAAEVDPNQPLGRGNLQDTDTDTISKRKSDFLATLKNQADTAKTEELHGKMMQSGDPSLIQIANTLGQGEKAQPIPFAPVAQTGGFTGGANPMDYFQDGGYDEQYAQDGTEVRRAKVNYVPRYTTVDGGLRNLIPWNRLVSSQDKVDMSKAYNLADKSAYTGDMKGYHPVETRVTKTGIFGRPKEWTHIYSNAPQADPYSGDLQIGKYLPSSEKDTKSKKDDKSKKDYDVSLVQRMRDKMYDRREARYKKDNEAFDKGVHQFIDLDKEREKKQLELNAEYQKSKPSDLGMDNPNWYNQPTPVEYTPVEFAYGGGLPKAQTGPTVKSPTNAVNAGSDPTNPTNEKEDLTKFTLDLDKVEAEADQEGFWDQAPPKETPEYNTIGIDNERSRRWDRDGEAAINVFNAGAHGVLGMFDKAEQENNFSSDDVYAHSNAKDRGAYGAYGSGSGKLKPDQYNKSLGSFSVQKGGYMQEGGYMAYGGYMEEGGYAEGGVVDMTEEELEEFLANGGEVEYLES
jgi:hypothetical protein